MRIIDADTDEYIDPFDLLFGKDEDEDEEEQQMSLYRRVEKRAADLGYSMTEIAECIGTNVQGLRDRFLRKESPKASADLWALLCLALDVDLDFFCGPDIDNEKIMTLLSLKAVRTQKEEQEKYEQKQKALRQKYKEAVIKNKQGRKP